MKTCSICLTDKEESEFGFYLYKGISKQKAHCKQCHKEIRHKSWLKHRRKHLDKAKIYRQSHKEEFRARQKKWYIKNRNQEIQRSSIYRSTWAGKIKQWKYGAKQRKIEWKLTENYLKSVPMICHYTGETLTLEIGFPNTVSLDRIDSSLPYIKENVVFCCSIINMMKHDLNKNIFTEYCKKVTNYQ